MSLSYFLIGYSIVVGLIGLRVMWDIAWNRGYDAGVAYGETLQEQPPQMPSPVHYEGE